VQKLDPMANQYEAAHGHAREGNKTAIYHVWCSMRQRCLNPKHKFFYRYGGRGITICERWESFELFLEDVGESPSPRFHFDRKDNDGNYEPGNVRWLSPKESARNRGSSKLLTFRGETMSMVEWAEKLDLPYTTLKGRFQKGWEVEKALSTPWIPRSARKTYKRG